MGFALVGGQVSDTPSHSRRPLTDTMSGVGTKPRCRVPTRPFAVGCIVATAWTSRKRRDWPGTDFGRANFDRLSGFSDYLHTYIMIALGRA